MPAPHIIVLPGGPGTLPALRTARGRLAAAGARDLNTKVITAAGVRGIDASLRPAALEANETEARALQLVIKYDPDPPLDSGSLETARHR